MFLCSLACESSYSKSGHSFPDWSWVRIRDSKVKSRQSRLIRTLEHSARIFGGVPGDVSPEKIRNSRSSNCWKCTEMVNLTITVLVLYHFKYFTIQSGVPIWFFFSLGGGGCVRTARTPLAYWPYIWNLD